MSGIEPGKQNVAETEARPTISVEELEKKVQIPVEKAPEDPLKIEIEIE